MTDPDLIVVVDANGDLVVPAPPRLSHTNGCKNTTHDPATSLCTNELMWPWTV